MTYPIHREEKGKDQDQEIRLKRQGNTIKIKIAIKKQFLKKNRMKNQNNLSKKS